jgi:hypothetical protein
MLLHGKIRLARVFSLDYDFGGDVFRNSHFSVPVKNYRFGTKK